MRKASSFLAFLATLALLTWSGSLAHFLYQRRLPNGDNVNHPCKPNHKWGGVGHTNPLGGGKLNDFGRDFKSHGGKWTRELCLLDSDSDGRTNGQELGDPSCTWEEGKIPSSNRGITNPGVCEPIDSDKCKDKSSFVNCEMSQFEKCDRMKQDGTLNFTVRIPPTKIPAKETNYFCMQFDIPTDGDYHVVAMEPILDNLEMIHHMLIFGCTDGFETFFEAPAPCGMASYSKCTNIVTGWTVGSSGRCWQDHVGVRIGVKAYKGFLLQVHWNNVFLKANDFDSSGLKFYYQNAKPEVEDLTMFIVGQQMLNIPPGQEKVIEEGTCTGKCSGFLLNQPLKVVSVYNHMHYLGRKQKVVIIRNGTEVATIAVDEKYSYDAPFEHYFDPPFEILPGDYIVTHCEYSSLSSQRYVQYGEATNDEMCYSFMTVYPASAFNVYHGCILFGSVSTCNFYIQDRVEGCDWHGFINLASPTMRPIYQALNKNCNLDGFCRPECYQIYKSLKDHPCMQGEVFSFIARRLQRFQEGVAFLGRLLSCKHYTPPPEVIPIPEPPSTCPVHLCKCP